VPRDSIREFASSRRFSRQYYLQRRAERAGADIKFPLVHMRVHDASMREQLYRALQQEAVPARSDRTRFDTKFRVRVRVRVRVRRPWRSTETGTRNLVSLAEFLPSIDTMRYKRGRRAAQQSLRESTLEPRVGERKSAARRMDASIFVLIVNDANSETILRTASH